MRNNKECIQLYTLEEAEKFISHRRRKATQKLIFKGLSFLCVILGLAVASMVDFDNGGAVVVAMLGLLGLVVPYNTEITW